MHLCGAGRESQLINILGVLGWCLNGMGRVLTGVNHPIETDRGCGRGPGGPWARVKTAERQMTRTETDSETQSSAFTGVDCGQRETGKHCLGRLGIKTDFIGAFCSQFPVRG